MDEIFQPVAGGRISIQIVRQIRDAMLSGQLRPGDRLPAERDLAQRFGVSRVTVRDAIRSLEALGLVEIRLGAAGGAFVTPPGTAVVGEGLTNLMLLSSLSHDEIAEARLTLELGSVALAATRATDDDIAQLRAMLEDAERASEVSRHEHRAASKAFHLALAGVARNQAISLISDTFHGPLSMSAIRARLPAEESMAQSLREHAAIVDALEQRDPVLAQRAMAAHIVRGTALASDEFPILLLPGASGH